MLEQQNRAGSRLLYKTYIGKTRNLSVKIVLNISFICYDFSVKILTLYNKALNYLFKINHFLYEKNFD